VTAGPTCPCLMPDVLEEVCRRTEEDVEGSTGPVAFSARLDG
jgi:hypothetical protein